MLEHLYIKNFTIIDELDIRRGEPKPLRVEEEKI